VVLVDPLLDEVVEPRGNLQDGLRRRDRAILLEVRQVPANESQERQLLLWFVLILAIVLIVWVAILLAR
jgi:hypothetical protein